MKTKGRGPEQVDIVPQSHCTKNIFAESARPLTALTRKDIQFQWANEQQQSFEKLKGELIARPTLGLFNLNSSQSYVQTPVQKV